MAQRWPALVLLSVVCGVLSTYCAANVPALERDCARGDSGACQQIVRLARDCKSGEDITAFINDVQRQDVLAQILKSDANRYVRKAAAQKIIDQELLVKIATTDSSTEVREGAIYGLFEQKRLAEVALATDDDELHALAVSRLSAEGVELLRSWISYEGFQASPSDFLRKHRRVLRWTFAGEVLDRKSFENSLLYLMRDLFGTTLTTAPVDGRLHASVKMSARGGNYYERGKPSQLHWRFSGVDLSVTLCVMLKESAIICRSFKAFESPPEEIPSEAFQKEEHAPALDALSSLVPDFMVFVEDLKGREWIQHLAEDSRVRNAAIQRAAMARLVQRTP